MTSVLSILFFFSFSEKKEKKEKAIKRNRKNHEAVVHQKMKERQQEVAVTFVTFKVHRLCIGTTQSKLWSHHTTKTSKNLFSETQLSRQITPRTKNGHAPPITQS